MATARPAEPPPRLLATDRGGADGQGIGGGTDSGAGGAGQVVGSRAVAAPPPQIGVGHSGRGQGLDGGCRLLDGGGVVDHHGGVGGRDQGSVEPGRIPTH